MSPKTPTYPIEDRLVREFTQRTVDAQRRAFCEALVAFWENHGRWPHWAWLETAPMQLPPIGVGGRITVSAGCGDSLPVGLRVFAYDTTMLNSSPLIEASLLAEWASFQESS